MSDLGLASLIAYFFCVLTSASIRSNGLGTAVPDEGILIALLAFLGATCFTLLALAMAEPYMLRHDNHRRLAIVSSILLALGPASCVVESVAGISNPPLMFFLFSLSGCGYAMSILIWGRIIAAKDAGSSFRQVLADTCAASIIMVLVSVMPQIVSLSVIALVGLMSGLIGSRMAVAASTIGDDGRQIIVSDTRDAIPHTCYFVGGALWMAYGVSWALLSGAHVFDGYLSVATIATAVMVTIAGISIARMHDGFKMDLTVISWTPVPMLVTGLVIFATGEQQLLNVAIVLFVLSMIVSYLHLTAHFAALATRPNMLSDQMFAWGWLAPCAGMFIGIFIGVACQHIGGSATNFFLPIVAGIIAISLIVSMRSVEKIATRRRKAEADQRMEAGSLIDKEAHMNEVLADIGLSLREREVAALLLQGRSQGVIAEQLFVAASTVNTHVKHIYQKAGTRSKQEFINLCQVKLQARLNDSKKED